MSEMSKHERCARAKYASLSGRVKDYYGLTAPKSLWSQCMDRVLEGWKPIDTAPKDGTYILIYGVESFDGVTKGMCVVQWMEYSDKAGWIGDQKYCEITDPTYWRPTPKAPLSFKRPEQNK